MKQQNKQKGTKRLSLLSKSTTFSQSSVKRYKYMVQVLELQVFNKIIFFRLILLTV